MTVIVCAQIRNKVIIASDRRTTLDSCHIVNVNQSKTVRFKSNFIVGAAGQGPVTEALWMLANKDHKLTSNESILSFTKSYYKQIAALEDDGSDTDAQLLIAAPSKIYYILNKASVHEIKDYWAIGSGGPFALATMRLKYPEVRTIADLRAAIKESIAAAVHFSPDCGGDIDLEEI